MPEALNNPFMAIDRQRTGRLLIRISATLCGVAGIVEASNWASDHRGINLGYSLAAFGFGYVGSLESNNLTELITGEALKIESLIDETIQKCIET